jgi:hypothetical protein
MIRSVFNLDPWSMGEQEFAERANEADWWVRNCMHPSGDVSESQKPQKK